MNKTIQDLFYDLQSCEKLLSIYDNNLIQIKTECSIQEIEKRNKISEIKYKIIDEIYNQLNKKYLKQDK